MRWICQGLGIRVIRERLFRAMNMYISNRGWALVMMGIVRKSGWVYVISVGMEKCRKVYIKNIEYILCSRVR